MTDKLKKEFTLKITQANSTELIVILYDMILVYMKETEEFWVQKNQEEYARSIQKIRNCIGELMNSLDLQYEMARNMYSLYVFFFMPSSLSLLAYCGSGTFFATRIPE